MYSYPIGTTFSRKLTRKVNLGLIQVIEKDHYPMNVKVMFRRFMFGT